MHAAVAAAADSGNKLTRKVSAATCIITTIVAASQVAYELYNVLTLLMAMCTSQSLISTATGCISKTVSAAA
jgi:hypothetical protein